MLSKVEFGHYFCYLINFSFPLYHGYKKVSIWEQQMLLVIMWLADIISLSLYQCANKYFLYKLKKSVGKCSKYKEFK